MRLRKFAIAGCLTCLAVLPSAAWADAAPEPPATDLSAYKEEPVPGGALAEAAYLALWLLVGGYALALGRRQAKLDAQLLELERRFAENAAQRPEDPAP